HFLTRFHLIAQHRLTQATLHWLFTEPVLGNDSIAVQLLGCAPNYLPDWYSLPLFAVYLQQFLVDERHLSSQYDSLVDCKLHSTAEEGSYLFKAKHLLVGDTIAGLI